MSGLRRYLDGRFAGAGGTADTTARASGGSVPVPAVIERDRRSMLRRGARGKLNTGDPALTRALAARARELMAGIEPGHRIYAELAAEVAEYVRGEMLLGAIDGYVITLADRIIDKRRRRLHQLAHDRRVIAEQLGAQRERIARLKSAVDLEARLAALEAARNV
jgi:hypothetical protein